MEDKTMVADSLACMNNGLKGLADMILQTENQQLRQELIKMRNNGETSQYELFTMAKNKNYYQPASKAGEEQIKQVKQIVSSVEQAK